MILVNMFVKDYVKMPASAADVIFLVINIECNVVTRQIATSGQLVNDYDYVFVTSLLTYL